MDFAVNDWGDVASLLGIIVPVILVLAWMMRRWVHEITDRIKSEIMPAVREQHNKLNEMAPNLTNDGTSAASYAHRAADAAIEAKDAAVQAKEAAVSAKDAALDAHSVAIDIKRILTTGD